MPRVRTKKSTKQANGAGSLWSYELSDGRTRWAVSLSVLDTETGGRRRTTKRGFTSQAEAVAWKGENSVKASRGTYVKPTAHTVGAHLDTWLAAADIRETTRAGYRTKIERHVKPRLGGKRLDSITRQVLEGMYRDLLRGGRSDHRAGEGLSASTVRQVHAMLSGAFNEAERDGVIAANPCRHVRMPKPDTGGDLDHEAEPWHPSELRRFLTETEADRLGILWRFLAMTGVRRGEALALRWSDLDLTATAPRASIRRSATLYSEGGTKRITLTKPKTSRTRVVDLDAATAEALRLHRKRQDSERAEAGERWVDHPDGALVFARDTYKLQPGQTAGGLLHPERVSRSFRERVASLGLREVRLHDLRHGWATMALLSGVHPKVVQERLGHSTIGITLDTYSHVLEGQQASAASTVAALLD